MRKHIPVIERRRLTGEVVWRAEGRFAISAAVIMKLIGCATVAIVTVAGSAKLDDVRCFLGGGACDLSRPRIEGNSILGLEGMPLAKPDDISARSADLLEHRLSTQDAARTASSRQSPRIFVPPRRQERLCLA